MQWEEERDIVTTKQQAQLKGWLETGTDTYMPKKTFEKYSLDNELTGDEKQKLYNSGDRHTQLYETFKSRKRSIHNGSGTGLNEAKQQSQSESTQREQGWSDEEIQAINPTFIDPRIESLKHLHPHQLNTWQ